MSGTVLEHPLVRDYLRRLDAACAGLPAARADELREQIIAHLEEALPPGAIDGEVRDELARLGLPAVLAAEAAEPGPRSAAVRLRRRLARLRWQAWTSIAAGLTLLAAAGTYALAVTSAAPLQLGGLEFLLYPQDAARAVMTTAGDVTQITMSERFGQRQGFVVAVVNDSDWTQTVVGVDPGSQPGGMMETVAVGSSFSIDHGGYYGPTQWSLPGTIPPHSSRLLRVQWTSRECLQQGSTMELDHLGLRVRVGIITRTENVPLGYTFGLAGTKTSSPVQYCGAP
jgi:hypothetical protein